MGKITDEQRNKAIEIALDGGDPKPFLKECGSIAPDKLWYYIKMQLKKKQPEVYEQLAKGRREKTVEVPEKVPAVKFEDVKKAIMEIPQIKVDGPIMIEAPEGNVVHKVEVPEQKPDDGLKKPLERIVGPCHIDKFLITAIKHPDLGEFYYDKKFEAVDWRTAEGEEISMSPSGWNSLLKDLPHILRILGAM